MTIFFFLLLIGWLDNMYETIVGFFKIVSFLYLIFQGITIIRLSYIMNSDIYEEDNGDDDLEDEKGNAIVGSVITLYGFNITFLLLLFKWFHS